MAGKKSELIHFPFQEVREDIISFKSYQLVHHSPRIAVLVADPYTCKVTVKSRVETLPKIEEADETRTSSEVERAWEKGVVGPTTPICAAGEPEAADGGDTEDTASSRRGSAELAVATIDLDVPDIMKRTGDRERPAKGASPGISITESEAEVFFQWQWEKLHQGMNEEDKNVLSMTVSTTDQLVMYGAHRSLSHLGLQALHLYQKAKALGTATWSNRFLLLVGHRLLCISKVQPFLSLDVDTLCSVLSSDHLDVAQERDVFRAAYRWLRFESEPRLPHASRVLACVRYELMPTNDLVKCIFRSRQLLKILLDAPPYPLAVLTGCIARQLAGISMQPEPEFKCRPRITIRDPPNQQM